MLTKSGQIMGRPFSLLVVVFYKIIIGLFELLVGLILLVMAASEGGLAKNNFWRSVIAKELAEDPNDFIWHWLFTNHLPIPYQTAWHLGLLVLILGLIKLMIAFGLWFRSRRWRKLSLLFLGAVSIFGLIELLVGFSFFKSIPLLVDLLLFYYIWKILPKYLVADKYKIY